MVSLFLVTLVNDMRKYLFLFALLFCANSFAGKVLFELDRVKLPTAINMIYLDLFNKPYMLSPELVSDDRLVSFRITDNIDSYEFVRRYINNMNIRISTKGGVDYLSSFIPDKPKEPVFDFVYTPKYRSVSYLSDILRGKFSGRFGSSGDIGDSSQLSAGQASFGSASDFMNRSGDVLVYFGSKSDIAKINKILPLIDVPVSEALVYGYVFEVQSSEKNGSGLALAAKLLSGKVNIGIGASQTFDNFIKINTGSLDALYELFKTDSRFHVVSSPRLRVRSGSSASFSVGSDVPVLGQVTYQGERPVQSVEYRSSGVIFNVLPYIRQNSIDIAIRQELSNFVKTDTGVNNSPTLIKRGVTTDVSVSDGDIILLGGLAETKDSDAETGFSFLPGFLSSSSTEKTKSDIVVILQVKKVSG